MAVATEALLVAGGAGLCATARAAPVSLHVVFAVGEERDRPKTILGHVFVAGTTLALLVLVLVLVATQTGAHGGDEILDSSIFR